MHFLAVTNAAFNPTRAANSEQLGPCKDGLRMSPCTGEAVYDQEGDREWVRGRTGSRWGGGRAN